MSEQTPGDPTPPPDAAPPDISTPFAATESLAQLIARGPRRNRRWLKALLAGVVLGPLLAGIILLIHTAGALTRWASPDRLTESVKVGNVHVSYPPRVGDELPARLARYLHAHEPNGGAAYDVALTREGDRFYVHLFYDSEFFEGFAQRGEGEAQRDLLGRLRQDVFEGEPAALRLCQKLLGQSKDNPFRVVQVIE